uniref:Uncharacterized protein n=1 Tax=Solanum tuberosum TaxID=4113 RepID=M1DCF3_SOLTU
MRKICPLKYEGNLKESMDTTSQKGTKRLKRTRKGRIEDHRVHLAYRRGVPRSSTMSPNDPEHDDAEGWCKMAMNYTKGRIAKLIGDSD